jgi:hypothetical protein
VGEDTGYSDGADGIESIGIGDHLGFQGARRWVGPEAVGFDGVRHRLNEVR